MIGVLTALGARWDSQLVTLLEGSSHVRIERRCVDLAELLSTALSGLGNAVLVSADLRGLGLSDVAQLREAGLVVVGVADPADEGTERRLRQLGVVDVLPASAPLSEFETALRTGVGPPDLPSVSAADDVQPSEPAGTAAGPPRTPALSPAGTGPEPTEVDDPGPRPPGRIVAVWGPTGAPGRTTVAVNLAAELAADGREILLVDADTYGGSIAQALSLLDEAPGLVAATRAAEQGTLDLISLAAVAPRVRDGLRVLTGIPRASRWPEVRGPALQRVLEVSRLLAQVIVVDCGFSLEEDEELSYDTQAPRRNQATRTVLATADSAVVVGGCDPIGLQRLVRGLQDLSLVQSPRATVVVNRLRPGAVGPRPQVRVADALARFAGTDEVLFVPDDQDGTDAALLAGGALLECAPDSPVRAAIRDLARALGQPLPDVGRRSRVRRRRPR